MKAYNLKMTVGQLIQNRPYNMVFDGKDFVVLPSVNSKYVSQPSYGIKQIEQRKNS
jgi:hypothetical protein